MRPCKLSTRRGSMRPNACASKTSGRRSPAWRYVSGSWRRRTCRGRSPSRASSVGRSTSCRRRSFCRDARSSRPSVPACRAGRIIVHQAHPHRQRRYRLFQDPDRAGGGSRHAGDDLILSPGESAASPLVHRARGTGIPQTIVIIALELEMGVSSEPLSKERIFVPLTDKENRISLSVIPPVSRYSYFLAENAIIAIHSYFAKAFYHVRTTGKNSFFSRCQRSPRVCQLHPQSAAQSRDRAAVGQGRPAGR